MVAKAPVNGHFRFLHGDLRSRLIAAPDRGNRRQAVTLGPDDAFVIDGRDIGIGRGELGLAGDVTNGPAAGTGDDEETLAGARATFSLVSRGDTGSIAACRGIAQPKDVRCAGASAASEGGPDCSVRRQHRLGHQCRR